MTPAELEMQREKGRLRAYNVSFKIVYKFSEMDNLYLLLAYIQKRNNLVGQDRLEFMRKQAESQSLRRKQVIT